MRTVRSSVTMESESAGAFWRLKATFESLATCRDMYPGQRADERHGVKRIAYPDHCTTRVMMSSTEFEIHRRDTHS
jgi:hypothetical protein